MAPAAAVPAVTPRTTVAARAVASGVASGTTADAVASPSAPAAIASSSAARDEIDEAGVTYLERACDVDAAATVTLTSTLHADDARRSALASEHDVDEARGLATLRTTRVATLPAIGACTSTVTTSGAVATVEAILSGHVDAVQHSVGRRLRPSISVPSLAIRVHRARG
jgi:hypothetical protein